MFLRATYYRWAQLWPQVCPDLAHAPKVLAVGDLHVENFGTWRDIEGRLIWGVNDFDEAWPMAYAIDLVRLAVSAHLAAEAGHLPVKREDICGAILEGYREGMLEKGCPFVLGESHQWLRRIAKVNSAIPSTSGRKWTRSPPSKPNAPSAPSMPRASHAQLPASPIASPTASPDSAASATPATLPSPTGTAAASPAKPKRWSHRPRTGRKASMPTRNCGPAEILYQTIINRAVRCPDHFVQLRGRWIVRRLGPRLLPHRTGLPAPPRHRTPPPPRHGIRNRQHPPGHANRPQSHPPPHRQTKTKVAAPGRRTNAPVRPRRLASLEEKRLRLIRRAPASRQPSKCSCGDGRPVSRPERSRRVPPSEARRLDHRPRAIRISTNRKRVEQAFQACVKSSNKWNRALAPEAPALHYLAAMPRTSHDPNDLLTQLEAAKNQFTPGQATKIQKLLTQLSKLELDPPQLIRFHESLLFLRAFPHGPSEIPRVENLLNTFHQRIEKLRATERRHVRLR